MIVRKIINRLKRYRDMNYKIALSKFFFYKYALFLDRINGVDFYQPLSLTDLGFPESGENIHYGATRTSEMAKVLKLAAATGKDSIVDFGSGKGLGLVNFKKFGFKQVMGIELSKHLCSIASENFRKLGMEDLQILNIDATLVKQELDSFNFFYFYNPFTGNLFKAVIQNIIDSQRRNPREITIIYNYPLEQEIISKTGYFKIVKRYSPFFFGGEFLVYKSVSNSK